MMEKLILDMMGWADITEGMLSEKQLITTGFGETLVSHSRADVIFR